MSRRSVRTVFDLLKPNHVDKVQSRVHSKQKSQKYNYDGRNPRTLDLYPDDKVMYRNYGLGDKWVQAEIQEKTGPVSYKCMSNNGQIVSRHQDQIIERDSNITLSACCI